MKLFTILITTVIGFACPANAEPTGSRTCRIVFPERPNNSPISAYLFDGKESQEVALPSMNFSEVIALPAGDLTIVMTPDAIANPEDLPAGAPKLNIAEGIQDFYILVSADPSNPMLPLRMNLVNAGKGKLKPGETLWFNLTDDRIVAKLGESKMSVQPKGQTVSGGPRSNSGFYIAAFAYQAGGKGDFLKITEQSWWYDAGSRHVGFMVDSGGRLPKIFFFRDYRLPE